MVFHIIFPKYFPRSKGMWKIFFGTLSVLGNTVMDLNNVMFSKGGHYTLYNNLNTMIPLNDTWLSGRVLILRVGRCWNFICGILSSALQHTHLNLMAGWKKFGIWSKIWIPFPCWPFAWSKFLWEKELPTFKQQLWVRLEQPFDPQNPRKPPSRAGRFLSSTS